MGLMGRNRRGNQQQASQQPTNQESSNNTYKTIGEAFLAIKSLMRQLEDRRAEINNYLKTGTVPFQPVRKQQTPDGQDVNAILNSIDETKTKEVKYKPFVGYDEYDAKKTISSLNELLDEINKLAIDPKFKS